jgi:hypothetical protein
MVQRSEKEVDSTRHIVVMFSPRDAEKAEPEGMLSYGIRVHLRLPAKGHEWKLDSAKSWQLRQVDLARNAVTIKKASDPKSEQLGNVQALSLVTVSDAKNMAKPALSWLYITAAQECNMTVEIVGPTDEEDNLKAVQNIFSQTFKASWAK